MTESPWTGDAGPGRSLGVGKPMGLLQWCYEWRPSGRPWRGAGSAGLGGGFGHFGIGSMGSGCPFGHLGVGGATKSGRDEEKGETDEPIPMGGAFSDAAGLGSPPGSSVGEVSVDGSGPVLGGNKGCVGDARGVTQLQGGASEETSCD
ncbi:unnamed protein product [Ilex paraguariensis]|uniref:Uncharacterized protein n=1 Tax=Ilex paraguariensis TaxID=185542 RepID=A0ABC8SYP8_9AQUA